MQLCKKDTDINTADDANKTNVVFHSTEQQLSTTQEQQVQILPEDKIIVDTMQQISTYCLFSFSQLENETHHTDRHYGFRCCQR